jgi:hypothetical protein
MDDLEYRLTLKTIWLAIYGNDLGNHMVDVGDAIVKQCVEPKARVPPLPRSLPYIVNHMVQGHPWAQPPLFYSC